MADGRPDRDPHRHPRRERDARRGQLPGRRALSGAEARGGDPEVASSDAPGERTSAARPRLAPHPPLDSYYDEPDERRRFVRRLFDDTAGDYDWVNTAMDLGSGRGYRRRALARAGIGVGQQLLDVAAGTGLTARAAAALVGPSGGVTALDASFGMLHEAGRRGVGRRTQGLAEELPVASGTFDAVTMGYALRHVADLAATFREYRRVLRPGGVVVLLELTRPPAGTLGYRLARFYLQTVVPALAALRGGRRARTLMRYFWDTIEHCVPPEAIVAALAEAGFEQPRRRVEWNLLSEYSARRPDA